MEPLLSSFLDLIFPRRCTFCDGICREPICPVCKDAVKFVAPPLCTICGVPFKSDAISSHTCGDCIKEKRYFSWARGVLIYDDASAKAIQRFKYKKDTTYSRALGSIISSYSKLKDFDMVVPVPLHIKRLRERGFNQSLLLARVVGKRYRIIVDPFALKRTRWTEPQVNLSGKERKLNVKGAFEVRKDVKGKRILLVDDVYTTGATVRECSKILKKSGAKDICVLTLARTVEL
ncbi:MAG: ComF family protein [Deltaproteobacteria bacterium]